MAQVETTPDGYVHARDDDEYQRLRHQAEMWCRARPRRCSAGQPQARNVLPRRGLWAGLGDELMADRPDRPARSPKPDRRQARGQALADLKAQGGAEFAVLEANVLEADAIPGVPFDLTYCRLFLMHMQEPVAALEKMLSWTKPGGVVAAQEFDFGAIAVEPLCPAMSEFNRLFEGVFRGHGRNLRAGRQLPAQFEAAGIGTPNSTLAEVKYIPLGDMAAMLIGVYQGLFASAVELGIADRARAEAFKTDMAEAAADGRYYCLTPILIGAWKRVS
ncbi:MAG: hypothetical protein R3D30_11975 [Hyphomicrobiales bacterium]